MYIVSPPRRVLFDIINNAFILYLLIVKYAEINAILSHGRSQRLQCRSLFGRACFVFFSYHGDHVERSKYTQDLYGEKDFYFKKKEKKKVLAVQNSWLTNIRVVSLAFCKYQSSVMYSSHDNPFGLDYSMASPCCSLKSFTCACRIKHSAVSRIR